LRWSNFGDIIHVVNVNETETKDNPKDTMMTTTKATQTETVATYTVEIRKTVVFTQTVVVSAKNKKQAELAAQEMGDDTKANHKTVGWRANPESVALVADPNTVVDETGTPFKIRPNAVVLTQKQFDLYQEMLAENASNGGDFGVLEVITSPFKKAAYADMLGTLHELEAIKALGISVYEPHYVNEGKGLKNRVTQYQMPRENISVAVSVVPN
jgi:hypothetical protein